MADGEMTAFAGSATTEPLETTLGQPLEPRGSVWVLDLSELPIFHGLSVLSRALGEMVIAQAGSDRVDITVERAVRPTENPELRATLGASQVKVCAEHEAIAGIRQHPDLFQDHLRTILGTLQRPRYRNALIPPTGESKALVFQLAFPGLAARFVLERVPSAKPGRCFLRITIEDPRGRRLDLESLPHVPVEDLERRVFIAGSTRIAQTLADGIRREAERGRRSFDELRRAHSHTFQQLAKSGLAEFRQVHVAWGDAFVPYLLESEPSRLSNLVKRVLLALEDATVRELLAARDTLRIDADGTSIYVDVSQLGRVLNLSLGERRERGDLDYFLDRMPATTAVVDAAGEQPFADVSVFLVHHMTAEVLGLIAALRRLGCRDLVCQFVQYSGDPPGSYLGPLLDLPHDEFEALALINLPDGASVEGRYLLSAQYSHLAYEAELAAALARRSHRWFDAMQAIALVAFLRQVERARGAGRRCLIIEDGGYLAPALNRARLEQRSVAELLAEIVPGHADRRPLAELLDGTLLGSVEHTRNGLDRLQQVQDERGTLAYPAFSIAVSRHKTEVESGEVAVSVLNAIENVLHANGRILSRRQCVVLGSRGAIGRRLVAALHHRLGDPAAQLMGVDLVADGRAAIAETTRYQDLPRERRQQIDLVLGVTGVSVLEGQDLQEWLAHGSRPELYLASGSTKTVEFAGLAAWVDGLLGIAEPRVGGRAVAIQAHHFRDPLTSRIFAHRYRFRFLDDRRTRDVYFLANLTPVNFMFYGVPTELIDEVLAELLDAALGLDRRARREQVPPRLAAVDRDITRRGEPVDPRMSGA